MFISNKEVIKGGKNPLISETEIREKILISKMTSSLNQGIYELFKIGTWYYILENRLLPIKWYKPLRVGTYVLVQHFTEDTEEMDVLNARIDLLNYINRINARYGFDLAIPLEVNG